MAKQRERNGSPSIPQFGAWHHKTADDLNFSMVFSQARANKKQHRHNIAHHNPANEQEMLGKHQDVSPRKSSSTPVPQGGAWDSKDRANKKPHKPDKTHRSLGNEQELGKHQQASTMKNSPMAEPHYGAWDQKTGNSPNYPMGLSQDRAKKKQHRHGLACHSMGTEQKLGKHRDVSPMKTGWMSVPQFGEWEQKTPSETNYSMVFSQARANRKKHKSDLTHRSYDFEQDLLSREREKAATRKKKKFMTYLSCCLPV
ncbi:uncharacterized protein LOC125837871 isoform X2 [Solanum verrucosum]|uniref:uncharacterized protein LOC125837871 isoform X2 n=1 Tax=Solanum verrucosum TaxID=315347 RepID=UPI0020D020E8|nr:uncharacterized protein LOC125837871 isoform X2 [Solanum verrucosum]